MRISLHVSLSAALALAACGGGANDQGGNVSPEDAAAQAQANGVMPRPGQYRTTQELIDFNLPGMPAERMDMVRKAFAQGAAHEATYCVTDQMTREQWLSDMAESNCTITRFDTAGGKIDVAMSCKDEQGVNGNMTMTGTSNENGSDMEMSFTHSIPGMGDGKIRMRVRSERIGDCA